MARQKQSKALKDIRRFRQELRMNQSQFWSMMGVTQSGGSRYENGRDIPPAVQMLLVMFESGTLTQDQLEAAKALTI